MKKDKVDIKNMSDKQFESGKEYLCGIGHFSTNKIDKHEVGRYDDRGFFYFRNGSYSSTELGYKRCLGSNATAVLTAKLLTS